MITSPKTDFWSEIEDPSARIPAGKLEYLRERFRNDMYDFVLKKFLDRQDRCGLTKADLARRLSCDAARLNRLLGAPGNWTLATVSDLLVGISGEALDPRSTKVRRDVPRNMTSVDFLTAESSNLIEVQSTYRSPSEHSDGAGSESKIFVQASR